MHLVSIRRSLPFVLTLAIAVWAVLVFPAFALAQPWVDVSQKTATSFRLMTQYICVVAIIAGAYMLMFGDGMAKKVIASCFFGVAIALNADTVMAWLF